MLAPRGNAGRAIPAWRKLLPNRASERVELHPAAVVERILDDEAVAAVRAREAKVIRGLRGHRDPCHLGAGEQRSGDRTVERRLTVARREQRVQESALR